MIGLAFSGGKDSWACLQINKDNLEHITVLWVNTGKNYPEALESFNKAKAMCKTFIEIKADRDAQNDVYGLPSDIIPFANTEFGQKVTGKTEITVQSYFACCYDNVTKPLMDKVKELGITTLISGKRNDEGYLSSSSDGEIVDGITHLHPIENWSDKEVLSYLEGEMYVPLHFRFNHTSLDCYDCSAYLAHTKDIFDWSAEKYPELHKKKVIRINQIKTVLNKAMETI